MHEAVFNGALVWLLLLLGALVVLAARQRSPADVVLTLDMLGYVLVGVLALFAAIRRESSYLDAALVLALLSFVQTVVGALYLRRGQAFRSGRRR